MVDSKGADDSPDDLENDNKKTQTKILNPSTKPADPFNLRLRTFEYYPYLFLARNGFASTIAHNGGIDVVDYENFGDEAGDFL